MTKNELRQVRGILDARQTELERFTRSRDGLTIDTSPDEMDRIQHATEREMAIGNLERDSNRLREVREALRRIDTSAFGICLDCDEEIGSKRLAAVPWTTLCIACQETADRASSDPGIAAEMLLVGAA